jgi:hypothetical protein
MANIVKEQRIIDSTKRALIKYVITTDGTTAANAALLDVSTLSGALNANGYIMSSNVDPMPCYRTTIKRIWGYGTGNVGGTIVLKWHANGMNTEIVGVGGGQFDYNFEAMGEGATIPNPAPDANTTGDIIYSSTTGAGVVTLLIDLKKDNRYYTAGQHALPSDFNYPPYGIK